jgi:hypothetical protein
VFHLELFLTKIQFPCSFGWIVVNSMQSIHQRQEALRWCQEQWSRTKLYRCILWPLNQSPWLLPQCVTMLPKNELTALILHQRCENCEQQLLRGQKGFPNFRSILKKFMLFLTPLSIINILSYCCHYYHQYYHHKFSTPFQTGPGANPASWTMGTGSLSWG